MNTAIVQPGDKLVVVVPKVLLFGERADYQKALEDQLPGVNVVIVHGAVAVAVYRESAVVSERTLEDLLEELPDDE